MTHQIQFARNINNILAHANETGLLIDAGWTMAIPVTSAIEYVKNYNTSPNEGFFEHEDKVILSHSTGKLTLSPQETSAVIELIKTAYGPL